LTSTRVPSLPLLSLVPAPSDLHTLSLHDALPISAGRVVLLQELGPGNVARHQVGGELHARERQVERLRHGLHEQRLGEARHDVADRKSTRLNSSHQIISYAVFCLKKKKNTITHTI